VPKAAPAAKSRRPLPLEPGSALQGANAEADNAPLRCYIAAVRQTSAIPR